MCLVTHQPKFKNCSAYFEEHTMTVLQWERLWFRCHCVCQRLSGGNSHNLFISPLRAAWWADCLLSLTYCGKDPHQRQEVLIGASSWMHAFRVVFIPPLGKEGSLSDEKKNTTVHEALTANSSQLHTYQTGADSSNELMGSSGAYWQRSSVAGESKATLCDIRGEKWLLNTTGSVHSSDDTHYLNLFLQLRWNSTTLWNWFLTDFGVLFGCWLSDKKAKVVLGVWERKNSGLAGAQMSVSAGTDGIVNQN